MRSSFPSFLFLALFGLALQLPGQLHLSVTQGWGGPAVSGAALIDVVTATPDVNGGVVHEVQEGQSLWGIANAYGTTIEDLRAKNHLPTSAVVWPGDRLVIQPSFTPTATPEVTPTQPRPAQAHSVTPTPGLPDPGVSAPALLASTTPLIPLSFGDRSRHILGMGMIVVCVLGLLMFLLAMLRRRI